jgi:hypothetical protein
MLVLLCSRPFCCLSRRRCKLGITSYRMGVAYLSGGMHPSGSLLYACCLPSLEQEAGQVHASGEFLSGMR